MARVIAGMTFSLDGFAADQEGHAGRLYPDFEALKGNDYMNALIAETGSVLMGRRTFEMAGDLDSYANTYESQVPIFVVTRQPPEVAPKQNEHLTFTFVTDGVESAVAQELLPASLVDELDIDVMPVFLGAGLRLFESPDLERIRLEKIRVQDIGARTNIRFRL